MATQTALSDEARDLVVRHLPMVKQVVAGVAAHYPRHTDREELVQAATLGLVEAAARYDGSRGVPFDRWAALRVRGAIVDAVRGLDFAPRVLRSAKRSGVLTAHPAPKPLSGRFSVAPSRQQCRICVDLGVRGLTFLRFRPLCMRRTKGLACSASLRRWP